MVKPVNIPTPSSATVHNTITYGAIVPTTVMLVQAVVASFHWALNMQEQMTIAGALAILVATIVNITDGGHYPPVEMTPPAAPADASTPPTPPAS